MQGQERLPTWLDNWRYPSPRQPNRSSLLAFAVVASQNLIPADDAEPRPSSMADGGRHDRHVDPGEEQNAAGQFDFLGMPMTVDRLSYASVVLSITVLLILTSLVTIAVIVTSESLKDVIGHYLVSLAVGDLLTGTLVTPLALYAALDDRWRYGDEDRTLCKVEAYLEMTLWSSTVYVFMWIGVDRYAALNKPSRYEIEQTFTRCRCWIVFTWFTSALLCCPTLFGEMQSRYYREAFVCILDWSAMAPYSVTLGVLVVVPSLVSVAYSYSYIIRKLQNPEDLEDNQKTMLETDPSYMMTFFVILAFVVSWLPWLLLRAYESFFRHDINSKPLHFCLLWLAIGGANWKILIYIVMNPEFRRSAGRFCLIFRCSCRRLGSANFSRSSSQYAAIGSSVKTNRFL